jgi:hypothetical protein
MGRSAASSHRTTIRTDPESVISMDLSAVGYNQRQIQYVISDINEPLRSLDCLQEISGGCLFGQIVPQQFGRAVK